MTATNHDNDGHKPWQWRPQTMTMTATNHDNDGHKPWQWRPQTMTMTATNLGSSQAGAMVMRLCEVGWRTTNGCLKQAECLCCVHFRAAYSCWFQCTYRTVIDIINALLQNWLQFGSCHVLPKYLWVGSGWSVAYWVGSRNLDQCTSLWWNQYGCETGNANIFGTMTDSIRIATTTNLWFLTTLSWKKRSAGCYNDRERLMAIWPTNERCVLWICRTKYKKVKSLEPDPSTTRPLTPIDN